MSSPALTVVFGSQMGAAMALATGIKEKISKDIGIEAECICMNKFQAALDTNPFTIGQCVVFVSSNFGIGESPMNGRSFERAIKKKDAAKWTGVNFAVLGIGHSMYPNFCGWTKYLDQRLEELGGLRIIERIDGDGNFPLKRDELIRKWVDDLIKALAPLVLAGSLEEKKNIEDIEDFGRLKSSIAIRSSSLCSVCLDSSSQCDLELPNCNPMYADRIRQLEVLHAEYLTSHVSSRRVIHVEFDVSNINSIVFHPGDCIGIPCRNDPDLVRQILDKMNICSEVSINISKLKAKNPDLFQHLPSKGSAFFILSFCCDLSSCPSPQLIENLSRYCLDKTEAAKMKDLATNKELMMHFSERYPNVLTLLSLFPSCRPSLEALITHLPSLSARFYSIGNSPKYTGDTIHIAFAVDPKGLCTPWLESLLQPLLRGSVDRQANEMMLNKPRINVFLEPSNVFHALVMEERTKFKPLLLIGPGTGCVPHRGILQHLSKNSADVQVERWLFTGHRHPDQDFLYSQDWLEFQRGKVLHKQVVAFSRDDRCPWKYVQNAMLHYADDIYRLLVHDESIFVICGRIRIWNAVLEAIREILQTRGHMNQQSIEDHIKTMMNSKRLLNELWG